MHIQRGYHFLRISYKIYYNNILLCIYDMCNLFAWLGLQKKHPCDNTCAAHVFLKWPVFAVYKVLRIHRFCVARWGGLRVSCFEHYQIFEQVLLYFYFGLASRVRYRDYNVIFQKICFLTRCLGHFVRKDVWARFSGNFFRFRY